MELREPLVLREVCVPQPNGLVNVELPRQVAWYPSVSEVHKIDVQIFEMLKNLRIFLLDQSFHFVYNLMHTRLELRIIILNIVNQLWKAPVDICLRVEHVLLKLNIYVQNLFGVNVADLFEEFIHLV